MMMTTVRSRLRRLTLASRLVFQCIRHLLRLDRVTRDESHDVASVQHRRCLPSLQRPNPKETLTPLTEPELWRPSPHRNPDVTEPGRVLHRGQKDCFGIKLEDRRRHLFICGKTGVGKSALMLSMITSDIRSGRGVRVIDPHGDLADAVSRVVPRRRKSDVILFDVGDRESPIAWNPLACRDPQQKAARGGRRSGGNEESLR